MHWGKYLSLNDYINSESFINRLPLFIKQISLRSYASLDDAKYAIYDIIIDSLELETKSTDLEKESDSPDSLKTPVLAQFERFRHEDNWWAYLSVVAVNRLRSMHRKFPKEISGGTMHEIDSEYKELMYFHVQSTESESEIEIDTNTEKKMKIDDLVKLLKNRFNRLPENYQTLIKGLLSGKTNTEISYQIGVSKGRISQMVKSLPDIFSKYIIDNNP